MLTFEEEMKMLEWNTVEDIFSQSTIDPVSNYRDIITAVFVSEDFIELFITATINNGNETLVAENIDALDVRKNWKIAERNPKFKKILLDNFARAISNSNISGTILEKINMEDESLIIDNWETITKLTEDSLDDRMKFISILNSTDKGKDVIDSELPTLFYGNYTYIYIIKELLSKEIVSQDKIADLIVSEPTRILNESIERYSSKYDFEELLKTIDNILTKVPSLDSSKVQIARNDMENILIQRFDDLLDKMLLEQEYDENGAIKNQNYSIRTLKVVKSFFTDKDKINEKLAKDYDKISKDVKSEETIDFLNLYSGIDVEMKELDIETVMSRAFANIKDSNLQWAISGIAKELLQDQKLTLDKMQIYGEGKYSKTIKVGDYVFKVGDIRRTPKIINDKRIIQPLFRRKLEGKNGEEIFIEVQNLVEKDWYEGLTEEEIKEELYKVYSEMRDAGTRWTDVRKENVGRLLKPNTGLYNINGQKLEGANEAKGFIETENRRTKDVLGVGELVVIDTDYIFDDTNEKKAYSKYSIDKELEERYLQEKMARKEVDKPLLLTSALELSKSIVTHEDMKKMAKSISEGKYRDVKIEKII